MWLGNFNIYVRLWALCSYSSLFGLFRWVDNVVVMILTMKFYAVNNIEWRLKFWNVENIKGGSNEKSWKQFFWCRCCCFFVARSAGKKKKVSMLWEMGKIWHSVNGKSITQNLEGGKFTYKRYSDSFYIIFGRTTMKWQRTPKELWKSVECCGTFSPCNKNRRRKKVNQWRHKKVDHIFFSLFISSALAFYISQHYFYDIIYFHLRFLLFLFT